MKCTLGVHAVSVCTLIILQRSSNTQLLEPDENAEALLKPRRISTKYALTYEAGLYVDRVTKQKAIGLKAGRECFLPRLRQDSHFRTTYLYLWRFLRSGRLV